MSRHHPAPEQEKDRPTMNTPAATATAIHRRMDRAAIPATDGTPLPATDGIFQN